MNTEKHCLTTFSFIVWIFNMKNSIIFGRHENKDSDH